MPLNTKGKEIKSAMEHEYGSEKGKRVFYASENKGTIKGVTKKKHAVAKKMSRDYTDSKEDRRANRANILARREARHKKGDEFYKSLLK